MTFRLAAVFIFSLMISTLFSQDKASALQKYFNALASNGQFNGGVLVTEKGKIVYQESFGYADFENKIPNTNATPFVLASVSKTFIATAVLQLAEAGKLNIENPVKNYLDSFPFEGITVRHLLSHTSGLAPYNTWFDSLRLKQPSRIFTNADFMSGLVSNPKPLLYNPGEKGNYDNINYIVLSLLIDKVSGKPFAEFIAQNVLKPAGMVNTSLVPMRTQFNDASDIFYAKPYLFPHRYSDSLVRATKVPYIVEYWSAYNFSGFGDYIGTLGDLLAYDKAYYNGALLSQATMKLAFTPVMLNNGKPNPANFGLGWEVAGDTEEGRLVYHNGNATGSNCTLVRNLSRQQTIIIFDNIHSNNAQTLAFNTLKILNGSLLPVPKISLASLYARVLMRQGAIAAKDTVNRLKSDTLHYTMSEDEMNLLGYDLMGGPNNPNPYHFPDEPKYKEALATFKFNTELFPGSWNVYDSYGEVLLKVGRKKEALAMYRKSVELNPNNEGGKKLLKQLSKE